MARFSIGVQLHPQHVPFDVLRDAWRRAEDMGVDAVFVWDHFAPLGGGEGNGLSYECMTTLAAMAATTKHVRVGMLVMGAGFRSPEYAGMALSTIDHISGGRAIVGIGAGWSEADYTALGLRYRSARQRIDTLGEVVPRLQATINTQPPGAAGVMPILIGGTGERRTLRVVAQHADIWHGAGDLDTWRQATTALGRHCAGVGRDPSEITRAWDIGEMGKPWDYSANLATMDTLAAGGVRHFYVPIGPDVGRYDLAPLADLINWRDQAG